ncbi:MAG: hypothetical protein JST92_25940, partial [Deltaproteobacteria bacterium]|nr:hypothetical protein [Deltaproteobacteria bacterium]
MVSGRKWKPSELMLAYRQAKEALSGERGGLARISLAHYEAQLARNIIALSAKLDQGAWFDRIDVGRVIAVPKATKLTEGQAQAVRIGLPDQKATSATVRLQLDPTIDFAIVEILYLWEYGHLLEDAFELNESCVGY